jgi:hypothetical protein
VTRQEARRRLLAGIEKDNVTGVVGILYSLTLRSQEVPLSAIPNNAAAFHALSESLAALTKEAVSLRNSSSNGTELPKPKPSSSGKGSFVESASPAMVTSLTEPFTTQKSRLFLSPLVSGLISLFRREQEDEIDPIRYYVPPPSVVVEAGVTGTGTLTPISYGQDYLPRISSPPSVSNLPPITIQVQAIDSRSFADHSSEIAKAVREALLNGHSLGDAVSEL